MNRILRIAVDAHPLTNPRNGIGRYTSNVLCEFALLHSPHPIYLYSDRPFQLDFPLPAHWKVRTGSVRFHIPSTAFAQAIFPVWALKDGINVFWSPRPQFPLLLPPRIRKVLTVHDLVLKRYPQTMRRIGRVIETLLMPLSLRIADQVIADSHFTRSELLTYFPCTGCKVNVVYLASSLRAGGTPGSCPVSSPYLLFVGSSEPRKNMRRMLLAYLRYRNLSPDPHDLVIVGSNQWGDFDVPQFIQTHDLHTWVHLIQNVDDAVLSVLYQHAQALVLVSLYEGFGLPLVEAMQYGIPLIASNNSSVAEIAGNAAILVDPSDDDAIAQAFRTVTEDQAVRSELAHNSAIRGLQFSWKLAASETMSLVVGKFAEAR
jgi:glycosyltransferase involved in cell wall biosynthesis